MQESGKPWLCPGKQHIIGIVTRNGSGIRVLRQLRESMPAKKSEEGFAPGDISAVIEGYAVVTCSICGRERVWEPGQEALERVIRQESVKVRFS
jgi:hypothetical protein